MVEKIMAAKMPTISKAKQDDLSEKNEFSQNQIVSNNLMTILMRFLNTPARRRNPQIHYRRRLK